MHENRIFIKRCIELAENGSSYVAPNPMVGCVILHNGKIIGEGFHKEFGGPHAEINAINSVKDKKLLKESTLFVNLEPCSHYGKTPPCADFIINMEIPKVVIGIADPFNKVAGEGTKKMKEAGIKVTLGIIEDECRHLNRRFLTFHEKKRPYIILKWAKSINGYIGTRDKINKSSKPFWITDDKSRILVHKWRSEEQAILIGTNTALFDNPQLNVREWQGKNPLRIIMDQNLRLPQNLHIFDKKTSTIIFTSKENKEENSTNLEYISIDFNGKIIQQICDRLHKNNIQSLFVEGGAQLLQTFINEGLWDEARIFTGDITFQEGVRAPMIYGESLSEIELGKDKLCIVRNN